MNRKWLLMKALDPEPDNDIIEGRYYLWLFAVLKAWWGNKHDLHLPYYVLHQNEYK